MANPDAYCFTSFRNSLFKNLQASRNASFEEVPEFVADAIFLDEDSDDELHQRLQAALEALTSRQREAIYLRFYEGLSYEEVAGTLGITVKATYKIVARGLQQLRDQMQVPVLMLFCLLRQNC